MATTITAMAASTPTSATDGSAAEQDHHKVGDQRQARILRTDRRPDDCKNGLGKNDEREGHRREQLPIVKKD
jgi:hypothetical protein